MKYEKQTYLFRVSLFLPKNDFLVNNWIRITDMDRIKILLVDDHQMLLDGIKSLLRNEDWLTVLAEATSGEKALEVISNGGVDMVITDINMPGMTGVELAREIKRTYPKIKILTLSMYSERSKIKEMHEAGVEGYLLKNTGKEELLDGIKKICQGENYYSAEIRTQVNAILNEELDQGGELLTRREREIIKMIAKELTNSEIGEQLFISERTVETHRKNIFRKTGVKSVVGLLNYSYEHGILSK